MPIEFACKCGQRFTVADSFAGRTARCKKCSQMVTVPAAAAGSDDYDLADPPPAPPARAPQYPPHIARPPAEQMAGGVAGFIAAGGIYESQASNPGSLRVDPAKYISSFPFWPIALPTLTLVFAGLGLAVEKWCWIGAGVGALAIILFCLRVRGQFRHGCVCPAIVISDRPWLVAVWSDLSTGGGRVYPAIRVLHQPLGRMTGGPPAVGQRLATVALYSVGDDPSLDRYWKDFSPQVVNCVSTDPDAIDAVLASIPPEEWAALDASLARVPTPIRPGLYKLW